LPNSQNNNIEQRKFPIVFGIYEKDAFERMFDFLFCRFLLSIDLFFCCFMSIIGLPFYFS